MKSLGVKNAITGVILPIVAAVAIACSQGSKDNLAGVNYGCTIPRHKRLVSWL